jgi:hypothetical protein
MSSDCTIASCLPRFWKCPDYAEVHCVLRPFYHFDACEYSSPTLNTVLQICYDLNVVPVAHTYDPGRTSHLVRLAQRDEDLGGHFAGGGTRWFI